MAGHVMKTLIVDDEPIARRILREGLETFPEVAVVGEAENGKQALRQIAELQPPDPLVRGQPLPGVGQDGQGGEKAGKAADRGIRGAEGGALVGALSTGSRTGAGVGAGVGGAVGIASAILTRGSDVRLDSGTTLEMIIQREVPLDGSRVPTVNK